MASQNAKYYPKTVRVRVPDSWGERIEAAAQQAETTPAEWHRNLIREGLRQAERAEREEEQSRHSATSNQDGS